VYVASQIDFGSDQARENFISRAFFLKNVLSARKEGIETQELVHLNSESYRQQDISISRTSARSGGWGIKVPEDASHVIHVSIDALINNSNMVRR